MKIPVVQRKEYVIYLERDGGTSYVHCDVYKWTKTTKASLAKDWETLCLLHNQPIYARHEIGDRKHLKFLEMFGFKRCNKYIQARNLKQFELFVKESPYGWN